MAIPGNALLRAPRLSGRRRLLTLLLLLGAAISAVPVTPAAAARRSTAAAEVAFTHGVLAFEAGDYAQAAALFEEAVRWNPQDGTALHWLGDTYLELGRYGEAVAQLAASLRARQPALAGKDGVKADLDLARRLQAHLPAAGSPPPEVTAPSVEVDVDLPWRQPSRVEGRIGLEVGRDSNPGLLPDDIAGIPPFGINPPRRAADSFSTLDLRVAGTPWLDRGGWSLGLSLDASQSVHQDQQSLDLTYGRGVVSLARGSDPLGFVAGPLGTVQVPQRPGRFSAVVQAGGAVLLLDGDGFLSTAEGAGSLLFSGRTGTTRLDLAVRDRRFERDGFALLRRSGTEIALGASRTFRSPGWDGSLRLGVNAGQRDAGRAFAASFGEAFAEVSAPLGERWTLFLAAARREDRFAYSASNLGNPAGDPRRDQTWRLSGVSVWTLSERLRWTLRASWAERSSNVTISSRDLLDYRRTVVATGLVWFFG